MKGVLFYMKKISKILISLMSASIFIAGAIPVSAETITANIAPPKDSATMLSLTYSELFNTLNSGEYCVSIKDADSNAAKTVAFRNGDTYVSKTDENKNVKTSFVVDSTFYSVNTDKKEILVDILNVPSQDVSVINYAALKFQNSYVENGLTVEEFKSGTNVESYYFDASKNFVKVKIQDNTGDQKTYNILTFSKTVPDTLFTAPTGYKFVQMEYTLKDTRIMKIFDKILSGKTFTISFKNSQYEIISVKDNYDYYYKITDKVADTSRKILALGSSVYNFNDVNKTYSKTARTYDDQCPTFYDTSKYSLEGIEKSIISKKTYLIETVNDGKNFYKFYWLGEVLSKIETTDKDGKVLDTTIFNTLSPAVDVAALTIPKTYTESNSEKKNISLGDNDVDIIKNVDTSVSTKTPAPIIISQPSGTSVTTVAPSAKKTVPKTGNPELALPLAISAVSISFIAILNRKGKTN